MAIGAWLYVHAYARAGRATLAAHSLTVPTHMCANTLLSVSGSLLHILSRYSSAFLDIPPEKS